MFKERDVLFESIDGKITEIKTEFTIDFRWHYDNSSSISEKQLDVTN